MEKNSSIIERLKEFALPTEQVAKESWWQAVSQIAAPYFRNLDQEETEVLFLWRDKEGDESSSSTAMVILDINCLTDHHSWHPTCLERVSGTELWFAVVTVNNRWRASYAFIPVTESLLPEVAYQQDSSKTAQRQWWMQVAPNQIADPLNPLPNFQAGWGQSSPLHMPEATVQLGWSDWDNNQLQAVSAQQLTNLTWSSKLLNKQRICTLFAGQLDESMQAKPLVILLDGQKWGSESGTLSVLTALTAQQIIAPANYLLIPIFDSQTRYQELSCSLLFWQAVIDELLPLCHQYIGEEVTEYLLAGQSLGGLSCLFAALEHPTLFSKVISLSGSFWWPEESRVRDKQKSAPSEAAEGGIAQKVSEGIYSAQHLQLYQTVGYGEQDMILDNDLTSAAIKQSGGQVSYHKVYGGHDWLSWRGELINGLKHLLALRQ